MFREIAWIFQAERYNSVHTNFAKEDKGISFFFFFFSFLFLFHSAFSVTSSIDTWYTNRLKALSRADRGRERDEARPRDATMRLMNPTRLITAVSHDPNTLLLVHCSILLDRKTFYSIRRRTAASIYVYVTTTRTTQWWFSYIHNNG